jgi:hypothetical protein
MCTLSLQYSMSYSTNYPPSSRPLHPRPSQPRPSSRRCRKHHQTKSWRRGGGGVPSAGLAEAANLAAAAASCGGGARASHGNGGVSGRRQPADPGVVCRGWAWSGPHGPGRVSAICISSSGSSDISSGMTVVAFFSAEVDRRASCRWFRI